MALVKGLMRWGQHGLWQGLGHICPPPVLTLLWQPPPKAWQNPQNGFFSWPPVSLFTGFQTCVTSLAS